MAGHVFISHASEDRDEADALVARIEAKGVTCWIAPRDVRPGFDYSEELQRALENCTAFVVLVTKDANTSPYVRAETEMAFSNQKPMLPVRMADIAPAPGLAFFLKIRHWTDAYGARREASLARLVLELQTLTGTAPSWAPKAGGAAPPPLAETPAPSPPPAPAPPPPPPAPPPSPPPAASPPPLAAAGPAAAPARKSPPPVLILVIIGAVMLAAILAIWLLTRRPAPGPGPSPGPDVNGPNPAPGPGPAPPPAQPRNYANELTDYGVQPKSELEANVGSYTPLGLPFGGRVTTEDLQRLTGDGRTMLIDVLADQHPQTLSGALYMPAGGMAGTFEDINQVRFALQLLQATGGDTTRPLVFFCAGASCWESYNAMLRANAAGYSQIYWYRGGIAAWQEAGQPLAPLPPAYNITPSAAD